MTHSHSWVLLGLCSNDTFFVRPSLTTWHLTPKTLHLPNPAWVFPSNLLSLDLMYMYWFVYWLSLLKCKFYVGGGWYFDLFTMFPAITMILASYKYRCSINICRMNKLSNNLVIKSVDPWSLQNCSLTAFKIFEIIVPIFYIE